MYAIYEPAYEVVVVYSVLDGQEADEAACKWETLRFRYSTLFFNT